jgi:hypothetical protein
MSQNKTGSYHSKQDNAQAVCEFTVLAQRSVVLGRVDELKTEYSRDYVPRDPRLAEILMEWRIRTPFRGPDNWLFTNPATERPLCSARSPYTHNKVQLSRVTLT